MEEPQDRSFEGREGKVEFFKNKFGGRTGFSFSTSLLFKGKNFGTVPGMIFSVEVPDTFAKPLHLDGPQPDRRALEALALDGYRSGELSRGQVSELLDLEVNETMAFLKQHGSAHGLTFEEHERSIERFRKSLER